MEYPVPEFVRQRESVSIGVCAPCRFISRNTAGFEVPIGPAAGLQVRDELDFDIKVIFDQQFDINRELDLTEMRQKEVVRGRANVPVAQKTGGGTGMTHVSCFGLTA